MRFHGSIPKTISIGSNTTHTSHIRNVKLTFANGHSRSGAARGKVRGYIVPGLWPTGARAQGARKSSGFLVKVWYRTITP